jgi:copper(I)-binding protein
VSSSLRRGALAASTIAFSVAALSACGAGNNSQTLEIKPDNAATSVGDIKVQNATVITQPDLTSTGPAVVSATIFNTGTEPETLQSIVVAGTGKTAELHATKTQPLTIPGGGRLILGGKDNASAVLGSSREAVQDGNAQKITFTFSRAGDVSLRAFVVPAESFFTGWGPSAVPSASASASSSASASGSGSPAAGSTASASAKGGKKNKQSASATPSDSASASTNAG